MTPPQPDDHTLNACLARVIGVEVEPIIEARLFERFYEPGDTACSSVKWDRQEVISGYWIKGTKAKWNPLHDANQMELVEAFIQAQHKIEYVWTGEYWYVTLDRWCLVPRRDKKRAFALAIWEMEQSNNNHKED